jgi:hypothetical protein
MRKTALTLALASALAAPAVSRAAEIYIQLPEAMPALVVIQPGVMVVPEVQHEVFFVDGVYWARHDGGWYRAENPHAAWFGVQTKVVPAALVKIPPGKYKNWKPSKQEKEQEKAERKAAKKAAKANRGKQ